MDLKGSLVDTNLKIYPSQKLLNFIKTLPLIHDLPENLVQLINGDKNTKLNKKQKESKDEPLQDSVNFSNRDIDNLNKIKEKIELPIKQLKIIKEKAEDVCEEKHDTDKDSKTTTNDSESSDKCEEEEISREGPYLYTSDIDWLYCHLQKRRKEEPDLPYLHDLFEGCNIEMPTNQVIKRNPVLEARCVKLRAQQEARQYRKMTKGVDNVRMRYPEDSISYQLKQINRQLIAIGQFIISIFAGFLFGFRGVEWMVGNLDFGFRLLLGVMCALVIALAEIYFLAKKLNEELNAIDTIQLGGPPKFEDQLKRGHEPTAATPTAEKEHQD